MAKPLDRVDPQWAWSPYVPSKQQPFNRARVAHLYRRAAFGANWQQIEQARHGTPAEAVKSLLARDPRHDALRREVDDLAEAMLATNDPRNLTAWWLYRMVRSPDPLWEMMTLLWHGHFATSAEKVAESKLMLAQNATLRKFALGRFDELVQHISRDPAMLIYLDSTTNRKIRPNENYARELMELFCLGVGNYTERDIQEIARCFTGWEVRRGTFQFNEFQHDTGKKSFLGKTGQFGGEQAVQIVLEQPAAARFVVRKVFKFFVCDEPSPPDSLLEPLAEQLRKSRFDVGPVVQRLLRSQLFFSPYAMGRKVRSPVQLGVGLLRSLRASTNTIELAEKLSELGQSLFFPPSVKGWDGGRTWINSSTILGRGNLVRDLIASEATRMADGGLGKLAQKCRAESPRQLVGWLSQLLLAAKLPESAQRQLIELAKGSGTLDEKVAQLITAMGVLPEMQLA